MEKERDYKVFKRKNGFTLIELLVVIAILALLVS
ncbi:MAG TPA: prepilin-type N-terminal cleavage/methylation domain-containing protein, partial [Phycisphaerae bacterium]|nr:prepilin-type N-terminal cleavage/methylation domain-containing protein [Phycisphaerae bacterium]